ncbi:MAG: aconitate hydratase AcnA [Anaerolineales bacterium]|nr:aconitate hydratase AcnA [Anaerolineales bacterium]MDW8445912.1 aconitate hydratase AcnA [Anaerolineales bacterium]
MSKRDEFGIRQVLRTSSGELVIYSLPLLEKQGITQLDRLPYSIRVLLESVARLCNQAEITRQDVLNLAAWQPQQSERPNLPFRPARVIMQDFTGVPAIVDLAAMRSTVRRLGGDPQRINPQVPVDLVIDHSVQVDFFANPDAFQRNAELEFQRNRERYEFLSWGQKAFRNFRVVPPATGIVHQVNLEYLAEVVMVAEVEGEYVAFPDTLVGTDSHTTMINGLGVVGWGVGGIEAEAAMLGMPIDLNAPDVVGLKLCGELRPGVTATDLTLTITQILRRHGVVEKFVEFFGEGADRLSLPDRATIANMAPEYGATMGYFPVDAETLRYLRATGRSPELVERVERYCKEQGLFRTPEAPEPCYSEVIELDLSTIEPSVAGPKRPQDRLPLAAVKEAFAKALVAPLSERGYALSPAEVNATAVMGVNGSSVELKHGSVVIAAITSCTNTSNPSVMVAAGLLAKKAVERGLQVKPYVKTSLAPGSRVVTEYLEKAGLMEPLGKLGFNLVGYGCTTCIGNSGPLPGEVVKAITTANLVAAAVLSGNRNFEGRIHPYVRANFLASPPLVVAYALAGNVGVDLTREPLGFDKEGKPVFLADLWPSEQEIRETIDRTLSPELFRNKYADLFEGNLTWNAIAERFGSQVDPVYPWDENSTYIQEPPFFEDFAPQPAPLGDLREARVLVFLGDSITTDHISPAGAIPVDSPAGRYLIERGVQPRDFNSYGARRGNDRVMVRGTFANIRLKNRLLPGVEGGYTLHFPDRQQMFIFDAAMRYKEEGVPLIVLAGKEYGSGSSRDWAAKGPRLLGVRAVLAESFERIHRSNLVGMGVLPLQFLPGENAEWLGLDGSETFTLQGISDPRPNKRIQVIARKEHGQEVRFQAVMRLNTPTEVQIYRHGGILALVLRRLLGWA